MVSKAATRQERRRILRRASKERDRVFQEKPHKRCTAIRKDGNQCRCYAIRGSKYCNNHGGVKNLDSGVLLDWVRENRQINGKPFSLREYPFMPRIYRDPCPYIVIQKSAQVGATEYAVNRALFFMDKKRENVIYTLPSFNDIRDFSRTRLEALFDECSHLWTEDNSQPDWVENVRVKEMNGRFIYFKGTWDKRHAISIPSGFNVHDELDFSKIAIVDKYKSRLGHSKYKWQLRLSTPTLPEWGINAEFLKTDQRHWHINCPNCGKEYCLCCGFPELISEDKKFRCPDCRAVLNRRRGFWKAKAPGRQRHGYHISALCAPWIPAREILDMKDDYDKEKDFWNFVLGLPYAGEFMPITMQAMNDCEDARLALHYKGIDCTVGVDQGGGDALYIIISKTNPAGRRQIVWVQKADTKIGWAELEKLMRQFDIRMCCIDAQPDRTKAREFAELFPGRVNLVYYHESIKEAFKLNAKEHYVVINRSDSLDHSTQRFLQNEVAIPRDDRLDLFKKHMCNLVRLVEEKEDTGAKKVIWRKTGDDDFAQANNYDELARQLRASQKSASLRSYNVAKEGKPEEEEKIKAKDFRQRILEAIYGGNSIICTETEYENGFRDALQEFAKEMLVGGQDDRAVLALEEVRRFDCLFDS